MPGISSCQKLMERMEAAGSRRGRRVQIALELIQQSRVAGHPWHPLMAVGWEEIVPRIVTEPVAPQMAM